MAASSVDGPFFVSGNMSAIRASMVPGFPVGDPNQDAGPSGFYMGTSMLDQRFWYQKDKVTGFTGTVPAHFDLPFRRAVGGIPAAIASNKIAAGQTLVNGVPMVLSAASTGATLNVPIVPLLTIPSAAPNAQTPVVAAMALDFGFQFGNCTAGSTTIPVASGVDFIPGMPLVIGGVGNSAGTACLLTNVVSADPVGNTIVVTNPPVATNAAAPIGTGNIWGPSEPVLSSPQNAAPTGAQPWIAIGPGLFLDSRQTIARCVSILGTTAATGGSITVAGWDIYGEPMSDTIVATAGATTTYGTKAFKYIASVTPLFTDAHNYAVGTADVFGLAYRAALYDDLLVFWNSAMMVSSTGFTAFDGTNPATSLTGDVRGTIQVSASGGGSGIGANASNGSIVSLAMSGRRLTAQQLISAVAQWESSPSNPTSIYGVPQA
jgi:hypothetical protein